MDETAALVTHYMGNAKMIRETMEGIGFECHGGQDAPYVFVRFPGRDSWDVFKEIMEKVQVRHRSVFRKTPSKFLLCILLNLRSSCPLRRW